MTFLSGETARAELAASCAEPGGLRIALVNNMADAALRKTEQQFRSLLGTESRAVRLVFTSLPDLPRGPVAQDYIAANYLPLGAALASRPDAVIVTGAEPRTAELGDEAYWPAMTGLFDWIARSGTPAAYCCLAAHAVVLHRNGIRRRPVSDKCFGVFEHEVVADHPFVQNTEVRHPVPHSRWNGVAASDLMAAGYAILSQSQVGVGAFATGAELLFQGHPEYTGTTLLREYRRDVRRFLAGERDTYPAPPAGTLSEGAMEEFAAFQRRAMADRRESVMEAFPSFPVCDARQSPWRAAGAQMYRNWLEAVAARAGEVGLAQAAE